MKKIFISGKITGERIVECIAKFDYARYQVRMELSDNIHDTVINPINIKGIHFGISHEKAMELCFIELKNCTHIYMLRDWKQSKGAKLEHQFAVDNNIKIIYQECT